MIAVHDAPLTPLGRKQAASLVHQVPTFLQKEVDLVVTSPLKRTLQTTKLGWGPTVERLGIENVLCIPQAQECNDFPCDTGSSREVLEKDSEFADFDLSRLTSDWTSKQGFYSAERPVLLKRGEWVRKFLLDRPEKVIVLVAHGDILRQITATSSGEGTHGYVLGHSRFGLVFEPLTFCKLAQRGGERVCLRSRYARWKVFPPPGTRGCRRWRLCANFHRGGHRDWKAVRG